MSFVVVAASRAEQQHVDPWRHVLQVGLQCGIVLFCLTAVGILAMFHNRWIIVDHLTLGYATIVLICVLAGVFIGRRALLDGFLRQVIGGAVAGMVATAILSILTVVMSFWKLRFIFVALDFKLLKMLSFGHQKEVWVGIAMMIGFGACAGAVGALLICLPRRVRRPISGGLIGMGLAGLFQELIRIILAGSSLTKPLHDLIYTWTGMTLQGAFVMFFAVLVGVFVWDFNRERVTLIFNALPETVRKRFRWGYIALLCLLIALFPLYAGNFVGQVMLMVSLFVLMGMGLNLEVGIAGLLDLGFVAFYAVGAYVTALLTADSHFALANVSYWVAMPASVVCAIVVGILFGVPVLRVRGDYLAVATLGLGEIVRVIVLSDAAAPLLAGAEGILQIPRPNLFGLEFSTPVQLFCLALGGSVIAAYCAWRLENSRLGRAWTAIRDDEDVAQALGINLIKVKLLAYGMGAAFAGLAGSIFAVMLGSIYPHSFQLIISINILALIIVGGMGSLPGVVLGAAVLIGMPEMLREFGEFRYLFYGIAIVAVMRLKPEGLWPSSSRRREMQLDEETDAVRQAEARIGAG